tara:strand:+ start:227 stop:811 length:585 start_codon:yes stop_codon:yes gene_type:complete
MKGFRNSEPQQDEEHTDHEERTDSLSWNNSEHLSEEELKLKEAMISWRRKGNTKLADACAEALKQSKGSEAITGEKLNINPIIIEELQQKINRIEADSEKGLTTIKVLDKKSEVNSKEITNNSKIKSIKDKDDKSKLKNNKKKVSYMIKIAARKGINEMISEIKIMNNDEKNVVRRSLLILFFIELIYIFLKRL